jgi:hypothetical protein
MKLLTTHILIGALLGALFLHPITMAVYWFEFHPEAAASGSLLPFLAGRLLMAFSLPMLPMTFVFLLLGAACGLASGLYSRAINRKNRLVLHFKQALGQDILLSLHQANNSEQFEYRPFARWNPERQGPDRELENGLVRTIAAFMNNQGGSLIVGMREDGAITGLESDYRTLQRKDREGFERLLALDGPSYRTRQLNLELDNPAQNQAQEPAIISGKIPDRISTDKRFRGGVVVLTRDSGEPALPRW